MTAADLVKILAFYGRFTPNYSRIGYIARQFSWSDQKPDFRGQRWLVTGASGGIGAAIVEAAAEAGADVIAVARSGDKLDQLVSGLNAGAKERVSTRRCDLSSTESIDDLLVALRASGQSINVLVNNVGVLFNEHSLTPEGFETTYTTNLLGHFQLTEGLLDVELLTDSPLIINMASGGLYNVPLGTKLLNVTDPARYGGKAAYAAHKRGQTALSAIWDERLESIGGRSYVMHPGWVRTEGVKKSLPIFYKIQGLILRTTEEGADTAIWLAANRPREGGRAIWFDRAVRPQHVFAHTHTPQCSEPELRDYLQADLERARGARDSSDDSEDLGDISETVATGPDLSADKNADPEPGAEAGAEKAG
ncbi:MAG: hypothetical protein Cons2KO_32530 [Congregibacter sp.]